MFDAKAQRHKGKLDQTRASPTHFRALHFAKISPLVFPSRIPLRLCVFASKVYALPALQGATPTQNGKARVRIRGLDRSSGIFR
jgi:hypothetical protein